MEDPTLDGSHILPNFSENVKKDMHESPHSFEARIEGQRQNPDIYRSLKPHIAIITLKIDIRAMNSDESLDLFVMGDTALQKYGLSTKGQLIVKGTSEAECIQKVQNIFIQWEKTKNEQG